MTKPDTTDGLSMPTPLCQVCLGENPKIRMIGKGLARMVCDMCWAKENQPAPQQTTDWRRIETWTQNDMAVLITDGVEVWKAERRYDGKWPREDQWCGEPTHWTQLPWPPGRSA